MSGQGAKGAMRRPDTSTPVGRRCNCRPGVRAQEPPITSNSTAQIRGPKGGRKPWKALCNTRFASSRARGWRRRGRRGEPAHALGDRPGQTAQSWLDAALLGHLRQARRKHHLRHRNPDRREGHGKLAGREIQIIKLDDVIQTRELRRRMPNVSSSAIGVDVLDRHGALRRADGHPQGGAGQRHADHRAQRRQRGGDARVCAPRTYVSLVLYRTGSRAYGMGLSPPPKKRHKKSVWVTLGLRRRHAKAARASSEGVREGRRPGAADLRRPFPQTNFPTACWRKILRPRLSTVGLLLCRRRRGAVRQGVRRGRPQSAAVRLGLPHRGTLEAQGAAAEGVETGLHYGDGLDNPKNAAFRQAFRDKAGRDADVYAVQGYDAAQLLARGARCRQGQHRGRGQPLQGLAGRQARLARAGPSAMSPAQNVTQNIYLRRAEGGQNKVIGIAAENSG